ncbi:hypothetical protein CO674_11915 [Rhizobium hidalgonense]|uniref:Uncharacterized protein n=1 Tax=Rhizobium hidalgonense TaxID=1538159 RepID=A0ABX4JT70_9HYPH|nr:hypothetical protein CO674_11915 [Rhizobium hidalgonense]RWX18246.1 hypothetical protein EHI42_08495 [Rhizobium hidalgonense]
MQPLIRPAGHLLPASGEKETRKRPPNPTGIQAGYIAFPAKRRKAEARRNVFHLSCALRPVDKNRQKP